MQVSENLRIHLLFNQLYFNAKKIKIHDIKKFRPHSWDTPLNNNGNYKYYRFFLDLIQTCLSQPIKLVWVFLLECDQWIAQNWEVQKVLIFVSPIFSHFALALNYTFVKCRGPQTEETRKLGNLFLKLSPSIPSNLALYHISATKPFNT